MAMIRLRFAGRVLGVAVLLLLSRGEGWAALAPPCNGLTPQLVPGGNRYTVTVVAPPPPAGKLWQSVCVSGGTGIDSWNHGALIGSPVACVGRLLGAAVGAASSPLKVSDCVWVDYGAGCMGAGDTVKLEFLSPNAGLIGAPVVGTFLASDDTSTDTSSTTIASGGPIVPATRAPIIVLLFAVLVLVGIYWSARARHRRPRT